MGNMKGKGKAASDDEDELSDIEAPTYDELLRDQIDAYYDDLIEQEMLKFQEASQQSTADGGDGSVTDEELENIDPAPNTAEISSQNVAQPQPPSGSARRSRSELYRVSGLYGVWCDRDEIIRIFNPDQYNIGGSYQASPDPDYDPPPPARPTPPAPPAPAPRTPSRHTTPILESPRAPVTPSTATSPATPTRGVTHTRSTLSPSTSRVSSTPTTNISRVRRAMVAHSISASSSQPARYFGGEIYGPSLPTRPAPGSSSSNITSPTRPQLTQPQLSTARSPSTPTAAPSSARYGSNTPSSSSRSPAPADVSSLPWYHQHPIVPIPPGMQPLPPFDHTVFPLRPDECASGSGQINQYISTVSVNPGIQSATWDTWRANIEAHQGFPSPYNPEFHRVHDTTASGLDEWQRAVNSQHETPLGHLPPIRVLPPPPRPPVQYYGSHWWVVYVGRVPGIYSSMNDVYEQITRVQGGPEVEIFSDYEAAIRWYWYGMARGFVRRTT
ncbi:uncharacterized protein STEHIDRAFT_124898 [Stereum hirsutum FP-91666 SS1]|uniref:uncharacterized protein n=1 Tax=Stereum hirsutum (strain FP-91666) TaxID=721885 RepID=UPI0004449546|nr:uncharacterized protein STEHIDRAFT_124898 [Stereum hirsutum FP-91666 SS1]EIM82092.1 hypothetical protein STEHIDRAFT_124898 [Stereum hirsutum FP-91666 SS1]